MNIIFIATEHCSAIHSAGIFNTNNYL